MMASRKVYVIVEYGGEWEDSWEEARYAFADKARAKAACAKRQERIDQALEAADERWPFDAIGARIDEVRLVE